MASKPLSKQQPKVPLPEDLPRTSAATPAAVNSSNVLSTCDLKMNGAPARASDTSMAGFLATNAVIVCGVHKQDARLEIRDARMRER
ncbi:uncharacterized protein N7506_003056 [Penicillium brevicompactum]|uniref:uncharacterized protein n=1 Tax=Penicillium brevicompactum TaxID=5074 RepID=UPI002540B301|nr:uncharacterized protein N7506_003056 [Penicillium brevicompactum]KAJ5343232.1 hypothetical protein N7506_003056 [Penicillium brevicompactum]